MWTHKRVIGSWPQSRDPNDWKEQILFYFISFYKTWAEKTNQENGEECEHTQGNGARWGRSSVSRSLYHVSAVDPGKAGADPSWLWKKAAT